MLTAINLFFSALVIVGLPIVVTSHLGFDQATGNQLYGYAEGALATGGLLGGLISGMIGNKLKVSQSDKLILGCTMTLIPIVLALRLLIDAMTSYFIIAGFCVLMMIISTLLSIQMITYVQKITPPFIIGKVMALLMCLVMCGNPIGQIIYGILFEQLSASVDMIFWGASIICFVLTIISHFVFRQLNDAIIVS